MSKQETIKVTLNKEVVVQHLIVKKGLSPQLAAELYDFIVELYHDTLMREGKVVLKNIGTICMKVVPGKWVNNFGVKKKVPTRYKLKFDQSRNFVVSKSPLKAMSVEDELKSLQNLFK